VTAAEVWLSCISRQVGVVITDSNYPVKEFDLDDDPQGLEGTY